MLLHFENAIPLLMINEECFEVAQQAREQSRTLRLNLSQSGLVLASLDIQAGAPQADEVAFAGGEHQGTRA